MSVRSALIKAGVSASLASAEAPRAEATMVEFSITTQRRASMFLAQVLLESGGLRYFEELASGSEYEGRADLGNTHPGDGPRYKGRGPIQLTGRANYRWAGGLLRLPLEAHPELASRHDIGWRIAGLYWKSHGLNELADKNQFVEITRRINGGYNGLDQRKRFLAIIRSVDCRPFDKWADYTAAEHRWIIEYDRLARSNNNKKRRRVLRLVMTTQRKRIWAVSQPKSKGGDGHGWDYKHRKARYHSLLARTR